MKKIGAILLLGACSSTPKSDTTNIMPYPPKNFPALTMIGSGTATIKSPTVAEPTADDWKTVANSCVTHLYSCEYNDQGVVTRVASLDQSDPAFHEFTEEALKSWRFEAGKSGSCFVQTIYERNRSTRVLVVPQDLAQTMVSNLKKNRAARPEVPDERPLPTLLRRTKMEVPQELALKDQDGYAIINFDIDADGIPTNYKVIDAEPENGLEANAISALKRWRYATLKDEPNSKRNQTVVMELMLVGGMQPVSTCDTGLKLNRLARAQETTTGPLQAPKPSLK
jgi:TonB family protein